MKEFSIKTTEEKQVIDLTDKINDFIKGEGFDSGICQVNALHTTVALSTADLDPGTDLDMLEAFYRMVPQNRDNNPHWPGSIDYRHLHNPEHTPDHIISAIIGTSLALPVKNGELLLGKWQKTVFFEFNGPQERRLVISFI